MRLFNGNSATTSPISVETAVDNQTASLALDGQGNLMIVWSDGQSGIWTRWYNAAGQAQASQFQINSGDPSQFHYPANPQAAASSEGDFVAIWNTASTSGVLGQVFSQRFQSNEPPQTAGIPNFAVPEGTTASSLNLAGYFVDPNAIYGDSLSYTIISNSNSGLLTPTISNGALSLAYAASVTGSAQLTIEATDQNGLTVETSFTVSVVNTATAAPVLSSIGAQTVVEQSPLTFTASASDASGLPITWSLDPGRWPARRSVLPACSPGRPATASAYQTSLRVRTSARKEVLKAAACILPRMLSFFG